MMKGRVCGVRLASVTIRHGFITGMLCLFSGFALAAPFRPYPGGKEADLWLLAGQSNMYGSAPLPEQLESPDPRIQLFNLDSTWIVAQDPLHRIFEAEAPIIAWFRYNDNVSRERYMQLRKESKQHPIGSGVGPGMPFARAIVAATNRPQGLIANSPGGSGMVHWDPALKDKHGDSLYGAMLDRVKLIGAPVKGMLWYQGETETMSDEAVAKYPQRLEALINNLRSDLNNPDLPIVMAQICRWSKSNDPAINRRWEQIRNLQYQAAQKLANVYLVGTADLTMTDEIHIDFPAQQRLGHRMAEVALSNIYRIPGHGNPISFTSATLTKIKEKRYVVRVRFSGVTGKLHAMGRPNGFAVRFPDCKKMTPQIYNIEFDPNDPSAVLLRMQQPEKGRMELIYGEGSNPYLNIVDDRDIPIPAFGPIELTHS